MFREMRRFKQILPEEETIKVLERGSSGVLAVLGDEGYPYAVPMSYVYADGKIFFHCAKVGHKIDAIKACSKVSFCVTDEDQVVPDEFTTYFRSAIAFGRARILEDDTEKMAAIKILAEKYSPDRPEGFEKEIKSSFGPMCMVEIDIDHLTGKEAIEFVKQREGN